MKNQRFEKLQLRHMRLEIFLTFCYGFGFFEVHFLVKCVSILWGNKQSSGRYGKSGSEWKTPSKGKGYLNHFETI